MEIVIRATVIFLLLFLLTRGIKKRALADISPFEMILLVTPATSFSRGSPRRTTR